MSAQKPFLAYVRKDVIRYVIELFTSQPYYRDERYETIEWIIDNKFRDVYGKSTIMDFKLTSDIDRAFRLVQQEIKELRGETWLKRQRQAGEISKEDYDDIMGMKEQINQLSKQLKLFTNQ